MSNSKEKVKKFFINFKYLLPDVGARKFYEKNKEFFDKKYDTKKEAFDEMCNFIKKVIDTIWNEDPLVYYAYPIKAFYFYSMEEFFKPEYRVKGKPNCFNWEKFKNDFGEQIGGFEMERRYSSDHHFYTSHFYIDEVFI